MKSKLFGEVKANDKLHLLMPLDQKIKEVTVVRIDIIKSNPLYRVLHILKPSAKPELITDEKLLGAHKLLGTNVTERIILKASISIAMVSTIPPTVIATSKEEIQQWMK